MNDSLVLLDFANRSIKDGMPIEDALQQAGVARWRAIVLTTMTTAAGLGPMLFEKSFQAQFLIPMAISLCFGLLFATVITLVLVPVISLIGNDVGRFWWRIWTGKWDERKVEYISAERREIHADIIFIVLIELNYLRDVFIQFPQKFAFIIDCNLECE